MKKTKILHVIDGLGRGGAETLLVDLLPDLAVDYEIILITLEDVQEFEESEIVCSQRLSLGYRGPKDIPNAVRRLRKIIRQHRPELVRSQLYWSTIVSRMATPRQTPYVFSVHATMNEDPIAWHKKLFINVLEKVTYRQRQLMIGVTQAVINSFIAFHPVAGRTFLLHNFVRDKFFMQRVPISYGGKEPLKVVSVSNLRLIKNIPYLVEAIKLLPAQKIMLDIYGDGPLKSNIQELIERYGLKNITLKGRCADVEKVLPDYHVLVSPSTVEGFGIAVAEAMSIGLPVIISDIPVYREVGGQQAIYLDNKNPESLAQQLQLVLNGKVDLEKLGVSSRHYAQQNFSKGEYMSKLKAIYREALAQ